MCYHPNKQMGNSQLASNGRIITPSFHLSSILMAERDKQSVNAPGVCVITPRTPAKARARALAHPVPARTRERAREEKRGRKRANSCFRHLSDYSSAGEAAGEIVENRKRDERRREGVSKRGTTCFCPSLISQLEMDSGSFSMGVTHRHSQGERIRAHFLKLLFGRGKCSAAVY